MAVPSYDQEYLDPDNPRDTTEPITRHMVNWRKVKRASPFGVALFNIHGMPAHCGVMLDHRRFIHAERATGVVVSKLNDLRWKNRLVGVYTHDGGSIRKPDHNVAGAVSPA